MSNQINQKKSAENAKSISLDLQQKTEIDQKLDYYKSILKAYEELSSSIEEKIICLNEKGDSDSKYQKSKLIIEKLESDNSLFEKKKFFEMWLKRSNEYDERFALITKECNDMFDSVYEKAKELSLKNLKLKSFVDKFEKEENPDQKLKNEFYLLIKYEVSKITGREIEYVNKKGKVAA